MVKIFRTVIIITSFFSYISGNDEEIFLRANKLYEIGDYGGALSLYTTMSQHGRAVLYNMGNCYFHKNDYAHALAYWTKSRKGATRLECRDIDYNKHYVLTMLKKIDGDTRFNRIQSYCDMLCVSVPFIIVQILFLLLWALLLYYGGRLKKVYSFFIVIGLLTLASILLVHYRSDVSCGFVLKKTPIFVCPDHSFEEVGYADYADFVTIKEKRKEWYKIRYSGNIGWVEADAIQII